MRYVLDRYINRPLNTPDGALKVFSIYYDEIINQGFNIDKKTILNIGSGALIGVDALFLLFGAARVISIDLKTGIYNYPVLSDQEPFYHTLWNLLIEQGRVSADQNPWDGIIHSMTDGAEYNTDRLIRLSPCNASRLPLKNNTVDLAFSNAVFEHIEDPENAIRDIARTLTPGGTPCIVWTCVTIAIFQNPLIF